MQCHFRNGHADGSAGVPAVDGDVTYSGTEHVLQFLQDEYIFCGESALSLVYSFCNMTTAQLRKKIDHYINSFDAQQLEAILKVAEVIDKNDHDLDISEKDWKETEALYQELVSGKVTGIKWNDAKKTITSFKI